jgi:hypothetical protein
MAEIFHFSAVPTCISFLTTAASMQSTIESPTAGRRRTSGECNH